MKLKIKIDRDTSKDQQQIKMNFRLEVTWKVSYIPRFNRLIQKKSNEGPYYLNDDLLKKKLNLKFQLFISLGHLVGKIRTKKHFTEESKLSINYQLIFVLLRITYALPTWKFKYSAYIARSVICTILAVLPSTKWIIINL